MYSYCYIKQESHIRRFSNIGSFTHFIMQKLYQSSKDVNDINVPLNGHNESLEGTNALLYAVHESLSSRYTTIQGHLTIRTQDGA